MSTSALKATTQLKNCGTRDGGVLIAYMKYDQRACKTFSYIVLKPDGTITVQQVSGVVPIEKMSEVTPDNRKNLVTFVGFALKYVSPFTNVSEVSTAFQQSELVTKLRTDIAGGKFAPIIQPSSK
jgi:hypothetical protein